MILCQNSEALNLSPHPTTYPLNTLNKSLQDGLCLSKTMNTNSHEKQVMPFQEENPVIPEQMNTERRRAEEKMRQVAEQTKEPIRWPRFPPIPTGIHTTKAPYEREQDYGLLALFRTEDDEEWQGELEDETVESEEEEESDVSGGEEVRGRYYGEGRPLIWRGDSWTSGDHDESDLEIADEFYDVDVDEIDMEAVKMEIAIKK